jgi:hypothetical protein
MIGVQKVPAYLWPMVSLITRGQAPMKTPITPLGELNGTPIYTTSYAGFGRTELVYPDDNYSLERQVIKTRNQDSGCFPMSDKDLAEERALTWTLMNKFTKAILSMDFTTFSFPVGYSEQRSFLERTADLFTFIADDYADQIRSNGVPETRLQLLAAGIIASFHIYMKYKKPWNPVLGETLVSKWPNGVTLFAEQSSHHPPISDFQIYGPKNEDGEYQWTCRAHCCFTISSGVTQVDIHQNGTFILEFDDGFAYEWVYPVITVFGIVKGQRSVIVKGPIVVKDTLNEVTLEVDLGLKPDRAKGITKQRHCSVYGGIADPTGKLYSKMTGDYSKSLVVDGEEVWNLEKNIAHRPIAPVEDELLLPSDSRFRLDRMLLINQDLPTADVIKVAIEECQRRERKLRQ